MLDRIFSIYNTYSVRIYEIPRPHVLQYLKKTVLILRRIIKWILVPACCSYCLGRNRERCYISCQNPCRRNRRWQSCHQPKWIIVNTHTSNHGIPLHPYGFQELFIRDNRAFGDDKILAWITCTLLSVSIALTETALMKYAVYTTAKQRTSDWWKLDELNCFELSRVK